MKSVGTILLIFFCVIVSAQEKNYMLVFLHPNGSAEKMSKEETDKIMAGHFANMKKLADAGKLLAAGPFEGGGGIFIMNTKSTDEVNEWLKGDPGVEAKRWNLEMVPYIPQHAGVCPVKEPYEMVEYVFARYDAIVSKYTASTYPQIVKKHNEYIAQLTTTGNVVAAGKFGDHEGGIIIMKGEVQREIFEADPGVQEGLMDLVVKKLYIARGSFCEK